MAKYVYTDRLKNSIEKYGKNPCFHIKRNGKYQSWTYNDFGNDLNRTTSALKKSGFKAGDNAIVLGENTPEWTIAYHAIILVGGKTIPVDPNLPAEDIERIIQITKSKIVFCSGSYLPVIKKIKSDNDFLQKIITLEVDCNDELSFVNFLNTGDSNNNAFERTFLPEDPMVILFTSGTTGKSKGAVLMQKNYITAGLYGIPRMKLGPEDTILAVLPLYHVFGFAACIVAPLTSGLDVVFVTSIKGPLILEALNDKKVSVLPAVPKMLTVLYDNIQRKIADRGIVIRLLFFVLTLLSKILGPIFGRSFRKNLFKTVHDGFGGNIKIIISGGASLSPRYFKGFNNMGFNILEGYGLTETFGPITICPTNAPRMGSVGPVFPENEVLIQNPDKSGVGEVLLRGITVFKEYYNDKNATDLVFDEDGWLHTGDLGYLSKEKYLYIVGRLKDVIVLDTGKNVFPDELEDYYIKSDLIEEIGIFGVKVQDKEVVGAIIVPSTYVRRKYKENKITEVIQNELIRMGKNRPDYLKIVDFAISFHELPKTSTRKLKKHELKKIFSKLKKDPKRVHNTGKEITAIENVQMESKEFKLIALCVNRILTAPFDGVLTTKTNLEIDLGLDSLKKIDFLCEVEETFDIIIDDEIIGKIETLGELLECVLELKDIKQDNFVHGQKTIHRRIASNKSLNITVNDNGFLTYRILSYLSGFLSKVLWGVHTEGNLNISVRDSVIFVSNHESQLDSPWIVSSLPWEIRRKTFILGKVELLNIPILSILFKKSNLIPVERQGDIIDALKASVTVLKKGKNILIFPEGTRSSDGNMREFKSGIGLLVKETNATIVPIKIKGSFDIWPKGRIPNFLYGRKNKAKIIFGNPINLKDLIDKKEIPKDADADLITDKIRSIIQKM